LYNKLNSHYKNSNMELSVPINGNCRVEKYILSKFYSIIR
jgi:hypothetical protein